MTTRIHYGSLAEKSFEGMRLLLKCQSYVRLASTSCSTIEKAFGVVGFKGRLIDSTYLLNKHPRNMEDCTLDGDLQP